MNQTSGDHLLHRPREQGAKMAAYSGSHYRSPGNASTPENGAATAADVQVQALWL